MKTFSEVMKSHLKSTQAARELKQAQCKALLESSKDVGVYKSPSAYNGTDYADVRIQLRITLENNSAGLMDIACDYCNTELIKPSPFEVLASKPPQQRIGCPGCGWIGYTSL
jgi:hypothetical protein